MKRGRVLPKFWTSLAVALVQLASVQVYAEDSLFTPDLEVEFLAKFAEVHPGATRSSLGGAAMGLILLVDRPGVPQHLQLRTAQILGALLADPRFDKNYETISISRRLIEEGKLPVAPIEAGVVAMYRNEFRHDTIAQWILEEKGILFLSHHGSPAIARELAARALNSEDPMSPNSKMDVIANLYQNLGETAVPMLMPLLQDSTPLYLRAAAATSLAQRFPDQAFEILMEADRQHIRLDSQDFNCALLEIGSAKALAIVAARIPDEHRLAEMLKYLDPIKHDAVFRHVLTREWDDARRLELIRLALRGGKAFTGVLKEKSWAIFQSAELHPLIRGRAGFLLVDAKDSEVLGHLKRLTTEELSQGEGDFAYFSWILIYAYFKNGETDLAFDLFRKLEEAEKVMPPGWGDSLAFEKFLKSLKDRLGEAQSLEARTVKTECQEMSPTVLTSAAVSGVTAVTQVTEEQGSLDELAEETLMTLRAFQNAGGVKPDYQSREHWMPLLALDPIVPEEGVTAEAQARIVGLKFGAIERALRNYLNLSRDRRFDQDTQVQLRREIRALIPVTRVELRKLNADHHHGRVAGEQVLEYLMEKWR